ncbi:MAG: riboflavin synthase [Thermodesulfobacteriota bacterium]
MFTGIIEGFGVIKDLRPSADRGRRIRVEAGFAIDDTKVGDSIAVNGACLTVVTFDGLRFEADVAPETLSKTTLGNLRAGEKVNLERALRFSDRLGGHLVTGHIDGTGVIQSKKNAGNAVLVTIGLPPEIGRYMVKKGSVAVDGISLTVNDCGPTHVSLSIIPHTAAMTTIGFRNSGDAVNIETDIIGKYVEHFLSGGRPGAGGKKPGGSIDMEFLAKTGFM